jgi:hypothetical protein
MAAAALSAAAVFSTAALDAQAPRNHIVVAETGSTVDFRYIDPSNGNVTTVTETSSDWLGGAGTVSVDDSDPNGIYTSAGFGFGGAPLWRLDMTGSSWTLATTSGAAMPTFGALAHMEQSPHGLLVTLSSVAPGLYRAATITSSMLLVTALNDAQDIAVLGDKVYVNSYVSGQPSTLIERDFATNTTRTLGTAFATVRSLGTFGGTLLAGLDNGEIQIVDPVTNTMSPFLATGLGPILAIDEGDNPGDVYFATAAGGVYSLANPTTPIYVTSDTLTDLAVSGNTLGQVRYGQGCPGALGVPAMVDTGRAMPGANYSFAVTGALPNSFAVLALGLQRTAFDLSPIGWTGCTLRNEGLVLWNTVTDGLGDASISLTVPLPLTPYYFDSVMGQYFVLELGTSPVASSNGFEVVVY